jgi:hypothetical protein
VRYDFPLDLLWVDESSSHFAFGTKFGERWWYRHACAAGGVFTILLMMGANLVGFVVGMDGAQYFAYQLVSSWSGESSPPWVFRSSCPSHKIDVGIRFLFVACGCLFVGVQLMFEYRYVPVRLCT